MDLSASTYLALITSQYQSSSKFLAWLEVLFGVIEDCTSLLGTYTEEFDLDTAVGVQLDVVGELVGLSRIINVTIFKSDVGFTWNDPLLGWNTGIWTSGVNDAVFELDDDTYRLALKVKIANNMWSGSIPEAYESFKTLFGDETTVVIQNNLDMSMELIFFSTKSLLYLSFLFINEYISFRPAGVKCNVHLNDAGVPYFAWNMDTSLFAGWNEGYWSPGGYVGLAAEGGYLRDTESEILYDTDGSALRETTGSTSMFLKDLDGDIITDLDGASIREIE